MRRLAGQGVRTPHGILAQSSEREQCCGGVRVLIRFEIKKSTVIEEFIGRLVHRPNSDWRRSRAMSRFIETRTMTNYEQYP